MYPGERFNSISHLCGALLAILGLVLLLLKAGSDPWKWVSFSIYGAVLILLYLASTLYHGVRHTRIKALLQKVDHLAIYLLIAGTYTPFTLITLRGTWGWSLFGTIWAMALFGIIQEFWLGKRTRILSMVLYLSMGWLILVAWTPLVASLAPQGIHWLSAGGLCYTFGIIFYLLDSRYPRAHGIWHLFVLAGSGCHYWTVLRYVA